MVEFTESEKKTLKKVIKILGLTKEETIRLLAKEGLATLTLDFEANKYEYLLRLIRKIHFNNKEKME